MNFIIDNLIVDKVSSLTSARGSLATVLITASLDAAGMGLVMPILPALLHEAGVTADAVPLNVGVLIALYAVMQFIFAPVLGTLSDRFGRRRVLLVSLAGATVDYLVLAISPHLPFLLAALLSASNLALTFILLRETRPDSPARSASLAQHRGRPGLSAVPGITFLLVAFGLVQFIGQAPGATWVLFTEHRLDWSPVEVGISLSVFGIVQVLVQALLTGRIVEWIGEAKTVIIGCVTDALGLVGLAIVTDAFSMAPILAALGIGGIGLPALQTLLSQRVDEQRQGRLQGVLASINSVTSIFGPVAFTTIFALTYINADGFLWLCAAALYVPCVILIMRGTAASPKFGSWASGDSM